VSRCNEAYRVAAGLDAGAPAAVGWRCSGREWPCFVTEYDYIAFSDYF
jgi:hypothetical protein